MTSFIDALKNQEPYLKIANHYKECFEKHGDTPKGLDWDNQANMDKRHKVMLELIQHSSNQDSILDFGCGYGDFYKYIKRYYQHYGVDKLYKYSGLDINKEHIREFVKRYPNDEISLHIRDIHNENDYNSLNNHDYIIINGVFTVKGKLTQEEMTNFMCSSLEKLWTKTNKGIAFNCMSKVLDYERDDLFHVSFDQLSMWIYDNLSSKFIIRQDYGLREFCVYIYK